LEAKIVTENLNAYFGDVHAVRGVNLSIPKNRITAIIGPSGCGKSTLIRCMNRMHEVVRGAKVTGKVLLDGKDIYDADTDPVMIRTKVGMVFQKPNPFPTMSIYDNAVAGLRLNGEKDWKKLDETAESSLKLAALWDEVKGNLDASGVSISGGQQQRLCIARALAVQPEVLLLDEPCSALDPIATAKIEDLLFDLKSQFTIVIVTHNMQQAARVADFTAFMYLGELIEFGDTKVIFENPVKELTEKYITGRFG
jgi:phosphate transport system ATP-binding protein